MRPTPRALAAAGLAALIARQALARPPRHGSWQVTNYRGRPVTRWGGAALAQGIVGGAVGLILSRRTAPPERRVLTATALAAAGAGVLGAVDDLAGTTSSKGLAGHLSALRHGELTTGAIKVAGLGLTGLATAAVADSGPGWSVARRPSAISGLVVDAALVAGAANLANLLDLRPGRAVKVGLVLAGMLPGRAPVVIAGAALAVLPDDLAERVMLGDCGANALGAALAASTLGHGTRRSRLLALGGITALTLASERISFSRVIADTPWMDRWDRWGRRRSDDDLTGDTPADDDVTA